MWWGAFTELRYEVTGLIGFTGRGEATGHTCFGPSTGRAANPRFACATAAAIFELRAVNKPFLELTLADQEYVYKVNVFSVMSLIQRLLPMMDENSRSHIVNISSMGGFQGSAKFAGLSAYSSSKAALACLTECLAEEFKDKNISFNCLALGAVQTEMLNEAFPGYQAPVSAPEMASYISDFVLNTATVWFVSAF